MVLQRVSRGVASDDALAGYSSKEDLFGVDPVAARSPSEVIEVRLKPSSHDGLIVSQS